MTKTISVLALCAAGLFAQDNETKAVPDQEKFYQLEFQVKELEGGKVANERSYYSMISTENRGNPAQMRVGGKVPYSNSAGQANYMDVGVNIDCRNAHERGGALGIFVSADISSASQPEGPANVLPTIRQNRWSSNVIVPLRKPTVIFSSDDPTSKRKMQLELTATPIN